jgi:hypothetical protein
LWVDTRKTTTTTSALCLRGWGRTHKSNAKTELTFDLFVIIEIYFWKQKIRVVLRGKTCSQRATMTRDTSTS